MVDSEKEFFFVCFVFLILYRAFNLIKIFFLNQSPLH